MDYKKFENPQRHKTSIDFEIIMEKLFETLETEFIDITTTSPPNMI